jgi:peptidoglycan/LPS O-acetylase OafA/YrhL
MIAATEPNLASSVQNTASGVQRMPELDALRGMAAVSVVFWHFFCTTYTLPNFWSIYWISRGDGAVVLFFLLSGFVLSLPFARAEKPTYRAFVIKRICRIYLPYLVGIGLSILVITFVAVAKKPDLSPWFNGSCGVPFNGRAALEHLFLIGNIHSNTYNNAIWSLIQEMRVSLVFPLLYWVVSRNKVITNLILCAAFSGISESNLVFRFMQSNGYQISYFFTFHIAALFVIGIMLAQYREKLVRQYRALSITAKSLLLLSALALYRIPMESSTFFLRDYGSAAGGAVFIVVALGSGEISELLRNRVFTFLGNISYSVYLNHLAVIYFFISLGYPLLPLWVLLPAIVAVTLLVSYPFWRWIERPAISLGKYLAQKTAPAMALRPTL